MMGGRTYADGYLAALRDAERVCDKHADRYYAIAKSAIDRLVNAEAASAGNAACDLASAVRALQSRACVQPMSARKRAESRSGKAPRKERG